MLTFSNLDCKNHTTQHTQQTALTGRQNLHAAIQLDKCNDPYQLDKLNKPHSLAEENNVPDLDTTRQTQRALPKNQSATLTYYRTVRTHHTNQLDKLHRLAKHLDDSTKSTDGFH